MTNTTADGSHRAGPGAEIRGRLGHPVIDADGHWAEYLPTVIRDAMARIGGEAAGADGFGASRRWSNGRSPWRRRAAPPPPLPGGVLGHRPPPTPSTGPRRCCRRLLYERLDELGHRLRRALPDRGWRRSGSSTTAIRRATCRAFNTYCAETFAPFADRMTPAAVVPMHTPDEAVAELDHAVGRARAEGGDAGQPRGSGARSRRWWRARRPARRPATALARHARHRQRLRLRPGVGRAASSSAWPRRSTPAAGASGLRNSPTELRLQPHRPLRRRPARPCARRCSSAA